MNQFVSLHHRFWRYVRKDDYCWEWTGQKNKKGYPRFTLSRGRAMVAHKFMMVCVLGHECPKDHDVHHVCENRGCVNPAHLKIIPHLNNVRFKMKTHCNHGHELWGDNLQIRTRKDGSFKQRVCVTCNREGAERFRARLKEVI